MGITVPEAVPEVEIDVAAVVALPAAPDAATYVADLHSLESPALMLFNIESGALPGLHRETYDANSLSLRAQLIFNTGFFFDRWSRFCWTCENL